MSDEDRNTETESRSETVITADDADGDIAAEITVETRAPNVEAASVLNDALSTSFRSITEQVFSDSSPGVPTDPDPEDEDEDDEEGGRIMDRGGR